MQTVQSIPLNSGQTTTGPPAGQNSGLRNIQTDHEVDFNSAPAVPHRQTRSASIPAARSTTSPSLSDRTKNLSLGSVSAPVGGNQNSLRQNPAMAPTPETKSSSDKNLSGQTIAENLKSLKQPLKRAAKQVKHQLAQKVVQKDQQLQNQSGNPEESKSNVEKPSQKNSVNNKAEAAPDVENNDPDSDQKKADQQESDVKNQPSQDSADQPSIKSSQNTLSRAIQVIKREAGIIKNNIILQLKGQPVDPEHPNQPLAKPDNVGWGAAISKQFKSPRSRLFRPSGKNKTGWSASFDNQIVGTGT